MSDVEPEDDMNMQIRATADLNAVTLKNSKEFIHVDGYFLHTRTFWPQRQPVKGVVLFIHGHTSHINRPFHVYLSNLFMEQGLIYATIDLPGHGHSDGLRGHIPSHTFFVDCVERYIEVLFDDRSESENFFVPKPYIVDNDTPIFPIGHSMGGAVTMLLAERLKRSKFNFAGSALLCPLLQLKQVPRAVGSVLKSFFGTYFAETYMPLKSQPKPPADDYTRYVRYDADVNNIYGLGDNQPVRFGTLASFLHFVDEIAGIMPEVDYPFIVFHDPEDPTVAYSGSEALIEQSKTSAERKKLVTVNGGHDIVAKRLGIISRGILQWILEELAHVRKT